MFAIVGKEFVSVIATLVMRSEQNLCRREALSILYNLDLTSPSKVIDRIKANECVLRALRCSGEVNYLVVANIDTVVMVWAAVDFDVVTWAQVWKCHDFT